LLSGSLSLVADAVHSFSDLLSDVIVLFGNWAGGLPPDAEHPYGHGKFETFAALSVALMLVIVGLVMAWQSGHAFYLHEEFFAGPPVLLAALLSVVSKELLYQVTRKVALQSRSPSVMANAWHHRSDALSSVAVLIGAAAGMAGWGHGDQVAGLIVGLMVAVAGARIGLGSLSELAEHAISGRDLRQLQVVLDSCSEIAGWHQLRSRLVGRECFVDVHLDIDRNLTVAQAHEIVDRLEEQMANSLSRPANITTHMEPWPEGER